jgi:hypothetical protein
LRNSSRFPLTGRGDINTYAVFAELCRALLRPAGRAGIIVPTGIATDHTTSEFFADLAARRSLVSLYDFENRKGLFPSVDSRYKFCLLTLAGAGRGPRSAEYAFFCHEAADLSDPERRFTLSAADFRLLNPNTRTAPIFRSRREAELTKHIYRRVPVLIEEAKAAAGNPWQVQFMAMLHMTNDSGLFRTRDQLEGDGFRLEGNVFVRGTERWLPLYEAKMVHQFDHRFGDYSMQPAGSKDTQLPEVPLDRLADPDYRVLPRHWVPETEVEARLKAKGWDRGWLLGWRDIARSTDERTVIAAVIPRVGVGNKFPLIVVGEHGRRPSGLVLNSMSPRLLRTTKGGGDHPSHFFIMINCPYYRLLRFDTRAPGPPPRPSPTGSAPACSNLLTRPGIWKPSPATSATTDLPSVTIPNAGHGCGPNWMPASSTFTWALPKSGSARPRPSCARCSPRPAPRSSTFSSNSRSSAGVMKSASGSTARSA